MLIPNPVTEEIIAIVFCKSQTIPIPVVPKKSATNLYPTSPTSIFTTCEKPKIPVAFMMVLCEDSVSMMFIFKWHNQCLETAF